MSVMSKPSVISRREFGGLVAAGAALPLRVAAERVQANPQQPDYVPPPRPLVPDGVEPGPGTVVAGTVDVVKT